MKKLKQLHSMSSQKIYQNNTHLWSVLPIVKFAKFSFLW
uniref:Uncharacterized protein n=1 Tax=Timema bartmani TaxID=61472 RepID=A0A7R9FD66_9NEOP|nr:unnamed protein product [Timema bartmani]